MAKWFGKASQHKLRCLAQPDTYGSVSWFADQLFALLDATTALIGTSARLLLCWFLLHAFSTLSASAQEPADKIADALLEAKERVEALAVPGLGTASLDFSAASLAWAKVDAAGYIHCYIHVSSLSRAQELELRSLGVEIEIFNDSLGIVQAWIWYEALAAVAELPFVDRMTPPQYGSPRSGSVTTEGDSNLDADVLRSFGVDGTGVRVGVISDGATKASTAQSSGDLPASITQFGTCVKQSAAPRNCISSSTCNEGTAIMEIIHDIAPGAELAVASVSTSLEMVERIEDLVREFHADVIIDDLGFLGAPYFEDGMIAQAVAAVTDRVVYVSSAGNGADGHYEAMYIPDTKEGLDLHNFGRARKRSRDISLNIEVDARSYLLAFMQWNDRFGKSRNDYDFFLFDDAERKLLCPRCGSSATQNGRQDPIEAFCYYNRSNRPVTAKLLVRRFSGARRQIELFTAGRNFLQQYGVAQGSVRGHAALPGVLAVGAMYVLDGGQNDIEFFSSRGPSRIDYPSLQLRQKPDLIAVDGVSVTGTGGFPSNFFGTSASAPHVAAIAALLRELQPQATPQQLRAALMAGTIDLGPRGPDGTFGAGKVDAPAAADRLTELLAVTPNVLPIANGGFESGNLLQFSNDSNNGGVAKVIVQGTCYSSNNTQGITLSGSSAALLQSNLSGDKDSSGVLTSLPFTAGSSIHFRALSETRDELSDRSPVELAIRVFAAGSNTTYLTKVIETNEVTLDTGCPSGEIRDSQFSRHVIDTTGLTGKPVRVQFHQHTSIQGEPFFTLLDDIGVGAPAMLSPQPGSVLPATKVRFSWAAEGGSWSRSGKPTVEWRLFVGSTLGGKDLYDSGVLQKKPNALVAKLPRDGRDVFVRLRYRTGKANWATTDFQYTAAPPPRTVRLSTGIVVVDEDIGTATVTVVRAGPLDEIMSVDYATGDLSATAGQDYDAVSGTLSWAANDGAPKSFDVVIHNDVIGERAEKLKVLLSNVSPGGVLAEPDVATLTVNASDVVPPSIEFPTANSTLSGADVTFEWQDNGTVVEQWQLMAGSMSGGRDILEKQALGPRTRRRLSVPTDGRDIFVRLFYRKNSRNQWQAVDFKYVAAGIPPTMLSPIPGDTLTGRKVTFSWTANTARVKEWRLRIGSKSGATDIFNSEVLQSTTVLRVKVPTDGRDIFVRLLYRRNSKTEWRPVDFQYETATL